MVSEVQRFDISGSPGSGNFTLAFNGSAPSTPIPYHPNPTQVQDALAALPTIGVGNVTVAKDGNWGYVCSFQGDLADYDLPLLVADDSGLGGGATITVAVVTEGEGPEVPPDMPTDVLADTLLTPCSLHDLMAFVYSTLPRTTGNYRNVQVSSSDTAITVSL
jgi:hypothetical protein